MYMCVQVITQVNPNRLSDYSQNNGNTCNTAGNQLQLDTSVDSLLCVCNQPVRRSHPLESRVIQRKANRQACRNSSCLMKQSSVAVACETTVKKLDIKIVKWRQDGRQWLRGRKNVFEHGGFPKGSQFDPRLPQSYCRRVLEQDCSCSLWAGCCLAWFPPPSVYECVC